MFSIDDFSRLEFLLGRWRGEGPDGKPFYEQYERPEPNVFQLRRSTDDTFTEHSDGSTLTFQAGEVISQWGEFTWRASSIAPDAASFDPINAPGQFSWHLIDDATLEARHRWIEDSKERQSTIALTRITTGPAVRR